LIFHVRGKINLDNPRREHNIPPMNPAQLLIRRATVDDLPALTALWTTANLPADELEGRLTEFQVVESNHEFAGAIGVQITRQHLRFYAEDFTDFSVADAARELLWERIQKLAANHGVFRVWTQEASPFWTRWGFQPASADTLERLPEEWKALEGRWLTLELKNEDAIKTALGDQFAGFMDDEKKQTAEVAARARQIRSFFTVVFFAIGIICFALAFYLLFRHPLAGR
jgi:N-acetylglutamate synthase-like GNAT family acetyltransferase